MKFHDHPMTFLCKWLAKAPPCTLEFSLYEYSPGEVLDVRDSFELASESLGGAWLRRELSQLRPGFELALHSRITLSDGTVRHIPMADLETEHENQVRRSLKAVSDDLALRLPLLFASGNSFHAYWLEFISVSEWTRFMGRLLLANQPGEDLITDTRWIGHRLFAGYAALRWSYNSEHYRGFPSIVTGGEPPRF